MCEVGPKRKMSPFSCLISQVCRNAGKPRPETPLPSEGTHHPEGPILRLPKGLTQAPAVNLPRVTLVGHLIFMVNPKVFRNLKTAALSP